MEFVYSFRLTCISISTVIQWMNLLGFKYELRWKGDFVEGHEKPATIEYRKAICERYLACEARMHRWVQLKAEVARRLEEEGEITARLWRDGKEKQRVSYKFYGRGASSTQPTLKITP